jgi:Pyruvate/2-oxoglutarate dehydrogenase complex, dihydrolipoamide dehydrogenase (E3) component, and related enzymes
MLAEGRDQVVLTIRENFIKFAQKLGIPIFYGRGILKDKNTVYVEGSDITLKTRYILLATGSSCADLKDLPADGKKIFNTDQIWSLREFPRRMLIVGGGAVGVEFAYIFRMYGVDVVLVELLDKLLPSPDIPEESSRYLARKLKRLGVDVRLRAKVIGFSEEDSRLKVSISDGSTLEVDCILVGVGRKPNTEGIGLEEIGVEKDSRGFVKVNEYCQTSVENIYACGDITSPLMLAHKSMYEGKVAVSHMLGERENVRNDRLMPKIIYSAYEVASVGLTEDQAEDEGYDCAVGFLLLSGLLDLMDGVVARLSERASKFGAVFDWLADKWVDGFVLGTVGYLYAGPFTAILAITASMLHSFIKPVVYSEIGYSARIKGKIQDPLEGVGFFGRPETHLTLALFAVLERFNMPLGLSFGIKLIAVLTLLSLFLRIAYLYKHFGKVYEE